MVRLTEQAHEIVRSIVSSGETVIDATVGNGYDTLFLAELVGPTGQVIGCDVQSFAIKTTRTRLENAGIQHKDLRLASHAIVLEELRADYSGKIAAVMFNLGYLPTSDMVVTTKQESTIPAIQSAIELLRDGGILTVIAYVAHPGGRKEAIAVEEIMTSFVDANSASMLAWPETSMDSKSPRLYAVSRVRNDAPL